MAMNKNELEYRKALISAERLGTIFGTLRHALSVLGALVALWLIFDGLEKVIGDKSPDGISAFAKVVEALNIGSIIGYLWGAGASVAWYRERKGKQRIIREKSSLQKTLEKDDPYRPSSGLTDVGGTPNEEVD
jgi:hypothetical protein